MNERINGVVAVPSIVAGISFPGWQPLLEKTAGIATPIITILGAVAGAIYLWNMIVTLKRNRLALREEREAANGRA